MDIGNQTMKEGVPAAKLPDSVIINPSFTVQELDPKGPDPRGKRGAAYRIGVTDQYVEVTIRLTGERIRIYPKA